MHVEILRISQDIDLKTGSSSYAAVMELPTGRVIRASVSEEDAKVLLGSLVGAPLPAEQPAPVDYESPPWAQTAVAPPVDMGTYPAGSHIFGGQDDPTPQQFEEAPQPPPPQPKPQRRPRTVQKNDMGYPVIRDGSVDPGEIVSTEGALDEEGIGQG